MVADVFVLLHLSCTTRHLRYCNSCRLSDTLIQNARLLLTMDASRRAIPSGDLLLRDGVIAAVDFGLPADGCQVINAYGCLVTLGLVNTHHHLYQTMTRAVPASQDSALFGWSQTLYPI